MALPPSRALTIAATTSSARSQWNVRVGRSQTRTGVVAAPSASSLPLIDSIAAPRRADASQRGDERAAAYTLPRAAKPRRSLPDKELSMTRSFMPMLMVAAGFATFAVSPARGGRSSRSPKTRSAIGARHSR